MAERLNRNLAKWDAANEATMRQQNEAAGGTWEEFNERHFPGPAWAYAISDCRSLASSAPSSSGAPIGSDGRPSETS